MANSVATLSRRLCRSLLSVPKTSKLSMPFCTGVSSREDSDLDDSHFNSNAESIHDSPQSEERSPPPSTSEDTVKPRRLWDSPLQDGLDVGVYKAILVGQVGQMPMQKKIKSGHTLTMFSVGTGGIRNNRRPLESEEPMEYAKRCAVQWHRVCVYPENLGGVVMKHVLPGSIVYLEGNLETKIFTDPVTGLVRRVREVSIRRNGRIVFLGKVGDSEQADSRELKSVGYY